MQIGTIKISQQKQMIIARQCDASNQLLHLHQTEETRRRICRIVVTVVADCGSNLGILMRRGKELTEAGITPDAITPEIVRALRKFSR